LPLALTQGSKAATRRRRASEYVDDHVDTTQFGPDGLHDPVTTFDRRQVRCDEGDIGQLRRTLPCRGENFRAEAGELLDDGLAQAFCSSRDQHAFSGQLQVHGHQRAPIRRIVVMQAAVAGVENRMAQSLVRIEVR
jgi:hypothetical protein